MSALSYSEPITIDDTTTVIHVTREGRGGRTAPVGTLTIHDGTTTWTATIDTTRIALAGVGVGLVAAALGSAAVLRQPPWPRINYTMPARIDVTRP